MTFLYNVLYSIYNESAKGYKLGNWQNAFKRQKRRLNVVAWTWSIKYEVSAVLVLTINITTVFSYIVPFVR